jgi:hypothetical protein
MSRATSFQEGYLGAALPQYAGSPTYLRKNPSLDWRDGASPTHESQNDEWENDYRGPSER